MDFLELLCQKSTFPPIIEGKTKPCKISLVSNTSLMQRHALTWVICEVILILYVFHLPGLFVLPYQMAHAFLVLSRWAKLDHPRTNRFASDKTNHFQTVKPP